MIPIADPDVGPEAREAVSAVLDSGMLADGPEVRRFEAEFADYCEAAHGVATANGTTALHAAFEALGVGDGDRVVTTPFSFVASANSVRLAGAEPVFADVDPETLTLDPESVEAVVREHDDVTTMLPVHLYGLPAEMDALLDVADDHDLAVVEDAAQAHGAEFEGERVGSLGDAAAFSFYPTKNMTTGEGGMVTTDRDDVADRLRSYVNHGREAGGSGYEHERVGHNYRMTSVAAALGRAQLDRLPAFNEARRANAATLDDHLADAPVETPTEPDGRRHVYHQYTIRSSDRDGLAAHLDDHGVGTGVYYPTPIHEQPAYESVTADAPVAERAADRVLSLPVHPNVSADDLRHVATIISNYER
jgi:dTDP-4-amino-4,6-dideoxygalactose transaminase